VANLSALQVGVPDTPCLIVQWLLLLPSLNWLRFLGRLHKSLGEEGVTANVIMLGLTETEADVYMRQETKQ
jgi:hypothetical protein